MTSIVFMGTPAFSVPILNGLFEAGYDVKAVVTQPDRPVGRKQVLTVSPIKNVAMTHHIPVLQPKTINNSDEMQLVIEMQPDFIVTAAYGQLLPTKILNSVKISAINVHASLLPKYRGGAPVHYAVMNNDTETGVSIIYMVKKMDAGDIIAQRAIPIKKTDNTGTMLDKLSFLGRTLLLETIPKILSVDIDRVVQDENAVTFSPTIKFEDERVDFTKSAILVDAKVRGLYPFPTSFIILNGVHTKLLKIGILPETTKLSPGKVVRKSKHELAISTGNGGVVILKKLQPAGKTQLSITDFLNGSRYLFEIGKQVVTI